MSLIESVVVIEHDGQLWARKEDMDKIFGKLVDLNQRAATLLRSIDLTTCDGPECAGDRYADGGAFGWQEQRDLWLKDAGI